MSKEVYIINKKIIKKINNNDKIMNILLDIYYGDFYPSDKSFVYNIIKKIDFNFLHFNKIGYISKYLNMYIFIFLYEDILMTKYLLSKFGIIPDLIYSAYYKYCADNKDDYTALNMNPKIFKLLAKHMDMAPFFVSELFIDNTLIDYIHKHNIKIKVKSLKYYIYKPDILEELLEISILNKNIKYAQILLNHGANINYIYNNFSNLIQNDYKYNLLFVALKLNSIKLIRFLISNGICLKPKYSLYKSKNINNRIIKYIIKNNVFKLNNINLGYNKYIKKNFILNKKYNIILYIC